MYQTQAHASRGNSTKIRPKAIRFERGLSGQRPMNRSDCRPEQAKRSSGSENFETCSGIRQNSETPLNSCQNSYEDGNLNSCESSYEDRYCPAFYDRTCSSVSGTASLAGSNHSSLKTIRFLCFIARLAVSAMMASAIATLPLQRSLSGPRLLLTQ